MIAIRTWLFRQFMQLGVWVHPAEHIVVIVKKTDHRLGATEIAKLAKRVWGDDGQG